MNYTSYEMGTIAETIGKLNKEFFIPAIQRPYVWEVEQIEKLFDSLMKEYPISTFLVWKPPVENKTNWHTYRFVQHFKYGELHNEEADLSAVPEVYLVLDGQQRLTSMFLGLVGSYRVRPKYKRKQSESSYVRQRLYLNLLKNPDEVESEEEEVEGVTYGFSFIDPDKVMHRKTEYWFCVGDILKLDNLDKLEDAVEALNDALDKLVVDVEYKKIARKNLKRLYTVVWEHRTISACIVKQPSYDKVLDIFVRANDGGTKLSKSDLLMSLVTLNWRSVDARDEIVSLLNEINLELSSANSFERDFILRSALLFCGQKYVFNVDSFTRENLAHIEANWVQVKHALRRAVMLVNSFGISNSKGNLTSNNSVMPIAYYVFNLIKKHDSPGVVEAILARNKGQIRAWLVSALFASIFSGAGDSTVVRATRIVRNEIEKSDDFPAYEIAKSLSLRRKNSLFDEDRVEEFLTLSAKNRSYRICLQLLYAQDEWEHDTRVREYIFPPSTIGMTMPINAEYENEAHRIANMVLLDQEDLAEFKALGPEEWLLTRNPLQKAWHLLPDDRQCSLSDFSAFIAGRKEVIRNRLASLMLPIMPNVTMPAAA